MYSGKNQMLGTEGKPNVFAVTTQSVASAACASQSVFRMITSDQVYAGTCLAAFPVASAMNILAFPLHEACYSQKLFSL